MADGHFKIHKGLNLAPRSDVPSNPQDGDVYYDSSTNKFQAYENGSWKDLITAAASSFQNATLKDFTGEAYNLAGASYDNKSFSVSDTLETQPNEMTFNNDGTKAYITGIITDEVHEIDLSTPFDISTGTYNSNSFDLSTQDSAPVGVAFSADGTKMFMLGNNSLNVYQYTLSTAFDVTSASYDSVFFDVGSEEAIPTAVEFNNDGTKMYVSGRGTNGKVNEYTLNTAYDLSDTVTNTHTFSTANEDTNTHSVAFSADGDKMFILGLGTDSVYRYTLSTPFDLSTASYDSVSFSVTNEEGTPVGMALSKNGTKMYIIGLDNTTIYQYDLIGTNTASFETLISYAHSGSENNIVKYSIDRHTSKETGFLIVTTNGTDAGVAKQSTSIGDVEIEFNAVISGSDLVLQYKAQSQGGIEPNINHKSEKWGD